MKIKPSKYALRGSSFPVSSFILNSFHFLLVMQWRNLLFFFHVDLDKFIPYNAQHNLSNILLAFTGAKADWYHVFPETHSHQCSSGRAAASCSLHMWCGRTTRIQLLLSDHFWHIRPLPPPCWLALITQDKEVMGVGGGLSVSGTSPISPLGALQSPGISHQHCLSGLLCAEVGQIAAESTKLSQVSLTQAYDCQISN